MAVAAYASVLSLMSALDNALLPSRCELLPNRSQIETLQEKVSLLLESLGLLHSASNETTLLDYSTIRQIREVVSEADDMIDKYVVDQLRGGSTSWWRIRGLSSSFRQEIKVLIQRFESITHELKKMMLMMDKDHGMVVRPSANSSYAGTSRVDSRGKNSVVGFEHRTIEIVDKLTGYGGRLQLQVISIVGMGGIGKTTLARYVFEHYYVLEYFDVRIWITVSQEYSIREILLGIRGDGVVSGDSISELGTSLHRNLFGRRYLIVMDDVWSAEPWEELRRFLPDNDNRSRILITTRLSTVASHFGIDNSYNINLLDEDESLQLLMEKAFPDGTCPRQFEQIGKKIVKQCGGLPLTLVAIGGLLANSRMTLEYWEYVADNLSSIINSESDDNSLQILSLSYNHLPIHLKPCFLSMGEFPKDSRIEVSELVELWVAVGLVRPTRDRNMEEVAIEYVKDLIDRSMLIVLERGSLGTIKSCGIQDLFRQICIRESHGEGFLSVPKVQEISYLSLNSKDPCFLCGKNGTSDRIQLRKVLTGNRSTTVMNPTVCDACNTKRPQLNRSRSVRLIEKVHDQRVEIPQMTKLRSLSIGDRHRCYSKQIIFASPSTISLLWNLQRLYFHVSGQEGSMLLSKIWEMPQLRHVHLLRHVLPDTNSTIVLHNLQTLTLVKNLRFTSELVARIPNVVRLSVLYDPDPREGEEVNCSYYRLDNLELLQSLRSLNLACRRRSFDIKDISLVISLKNISFPSSLKKLTLKDTRLLWEDMSVIGSLPNLEALKLNRDAFVGDEWCAGEDEFLRLRYLKLEDLDLVSWTVDWYAFPALNKLVLVGLCQLQEFPLEIGELPEIKTIHATCCSEYVVDKVKQIMDERDDLQIVLQED